jgi:hypothetical protein
MRKPLFGALMLAAAASAFGQAPPNDDPAGAIAVALGINPGAPAGASANFFTNVNATSSAGYTATCGTGAGSDVFFTFSAATSAVHLFALCPPAGYAPGTLGDAILNVYDAAAPTVSLACDDNACVLNSPGTFSNLPQIALSLTSGTIYLLRVSVSGTNPTGSFYLSVAVTPPAVGENCATALAISEGVHAGQLFGATASGTSVTGCVFFSAVTIDVYYDFTPAVGGTLILQREAGAATRMAITTGACGAEVLVTGACTATSYLVATVVAGTTYHLRFGPSTAATTALAGAFLFSLRVVSPTTADSCATATTGANGANGGVTIGGTSDASVAACAGFTSASAIDTWTAYTPPANGQLTYRVAGVSNPQLAVYTSGACGALLGASCPTNGVNGFGATVSVTAGQPVYFRVGQSTVASLGVYNVELSFASAPANDDCANAVPLALGLNGPYSNAGASDGAVIASCASSFRDTWHSFTATQTGRIKVSACGSGGDAVLTAYASCGGAEIACDDDDAGNSGPCATSQTTAPYLEIDVVAGATYLLRLAAKTATSFSYQLDVSYRFSLVITPNVPAQTITIANVAGTPGATIVNAVTFYAGAWPQGWLYGVDVPLPELLGLMAVGPPFLLVLGPSGAASTTFTGAPLPFGLTLYAVGVELGASGFPVRATNAFTVAL